MRNRTEDVANPTGKPNWRSVSTNQPPYSAIKRVRVLQEGCEINCGTCWFVSNNTAITAAHVVESWGNSAVEILVDTSNESSNRVCGVSIPTNHVNSDSCDPWDIALLRFDQGQRSWLARGVPNSAIRVIGFPYSNASTMVESQGGMVIPADNRLLLHSADTSDGFSGAPVLNQSEQRATGIHIGGYNINPYDDQYPQYNVALLLRPEINRMIDEHVEIWG